MQWYADANWFDVYNIHADLVSLLLTELGPDFNGQLVGFETVSGHLGHIVSRRPELGPESTQILDVMPENLTASKFNTSLQHESAAK